MEAANMPAEEPGARPESERGLISVGIITYDRPHGLRRALEGVTGQTYRNLDIIVSDDASPGEATAEVVREFMARDPRIRYFRQDRNLGFNRNFRFVYEQGRGEFWAWAADDDAWDPEFAEACMANLLDPAKRTVMAFSHVRRVDRDTGEVVAERYSDNIASPSRSLLARSFKYIYHSGSNQAFYGLYRREAINPWFWRQCAGNDHLALTSILLRGCIHVDARVLFTSAIGGSGFRRETFHRYYDSKIGKIAINLSSTLAWAYEYSRYVWVEPGYRLRHRPVLQLFVLIRFLRPRYWRRFAGDIYSLLFNPRIWRFE